MPGPDAGWVLIVDDEVDNCRNLSDILTDLGFRVDCATEGQGALDLVRQKHYDVALLDLRMPGMDGLALYREIKKIRAGTVAILVTAYASHATAEEAIEAGAWRIVSKPVSLPGLLGLVDEAMAQPLVLVVDDDLDLCENLWQILRDRGFRVGLAHDGLDAARQIGDRSYSVVLIDMKLPGGDGGEVFRMVREANPTCRAVLITGYPAETGRSIGLALANGADGVCYKPFDIPQLLGKIERLAHARGDDPGSAGQAGPSR